MLTRQTKTNRNKIASIVCGVVLLIGCNSPEEVASDHFQKGKELFEKGEFDKAFLELKSSNQDDDKRGETYYYMALLDEKANNIKSMRQNLIRAVELEPNLIEARIKLGKINILFGDFEKAMEQAEAVLKVDSSSVDAQLVKASVYVRQGKKDQADEIVNEVLKLNPDNIDALSISAAIFYERDDKPKALALIEKIIEKDNKNLPARLFKIRINAAQNNVDKVIEGYKEIIDLYPDNNNFKLSLASIYSMTNKLDLAEALLRERVDKEKDNVEPLIVLLEFLNAKAKDRVISEYEHMLGRYQQQANLLLELSKWMVASAYPEVAKKGLQQVVELEKNTDTGLAAQTILAEIALGNKQYDTVESALGSILGANSEFIQANLLKARLLLVQNKTDEAIEFLNKLIWSKKSADDVYSLLGQAFLVKKDRKLADKHFKQALEANPANVGAFIQVYGSYLQAGQRETARQYLEKALAIKPNQTLFLINKAELDILEKKWDDAQNAVQRVALFSRDKGVPLYLQANVLQGKKKYVEAIALYDKVLQDFPGHLNSMINLARSHEALGGRNKAIAYLEAHHNKHLDDLSIVGVLTDLYLADKDYDKAKKILTDHIKRLPKSVAAYLALARVETIVNKNVLAAKNVYLEGLRANQDDPQISMALAGLYEKTNDKDGARKIYEKLLAKAPENNLASNNLASLLIDSNNIEDINKGVELAEKFKDSESAYFQDTYAWGLVKSGKAPEGLKLLESLVLKEPKLPEFRYHLGVAHYNNGNKATAISELKQAITLSEKQKRDFSGKDDAKKMLQEIDHSANK